MPDTYKIHLPQFEGPFDLLLFFIERDELDIYDIPIAQITDDFLSYLHHMEMMNIELASEFILVASTLMRIKAKMLLPRRELNEEGEEIDPREELVNRLIEYRRYKEVSESLKNLETKRLMHEKRGNVKKELNHIAEVFSTESELQNLSLYKLMKAFNKVMNRYAEEQNKPRHTVINYPFSIKGQKSYLRTRVQKLGRPASFEDVFAELESRIHGIFTFLAMLELIQEGKLNIKVAKGINHFWLTAA
jgi:segregation and condensation protein A